MCIEKLYVPAEIVGQLKKSDEVLKAEEEIRGLTLEERVSRINLRKHRKLSSLSTMKMIWALKQWKYLPTHLIKYSVLKGSGSEHVSHYTQIGFTEIKNVMQLYRINKEQLAELMEISVSTLKRRIRAEEKIPIRVIEKPTSTYPTG